jgi:hypothetical protein
MGRYLDEGMAAGRLGIRLFTGITGTLCGILARPADVLLLDGERRKAVARVEP